MTILCIDYTIRYVSVSVLNDTIKLVLLVGDSGAVLGKVKSSLDALFSCSLADEAVGEAITLITILLLLIDGLERALLNPSTGVGDSKVAWLSHGC